MIVMMICHYDETNSSGGLDKQARLLSRILRAEGEDVVVLGSTRKFSNAKWSRDGDVPVRLFWTYASPQVSGRYFPAAIVWAVQLLAWIAYHRATVSVLHCHQIRIHSLVAALARKLFGIPVIQKSATGGTGADIRAIGTRKYFGPPGRRFLIHNSDRFIATTASIQSDLLSYKVPPDKISIVPNGLELSAAVDSPVPPEVRARRCLFLARLAPDKNAPALAAAALKVAKDTGLTVHFYGKGEEQQKLETVLQPFKDDPTVAYMGWVSDVAGVLDQYGFLLLPSNAEGLSNSMIEAMSRGVVPVTTRVSGCVDHIEHGKNGFFFDGVDENSLADGLRTIAAVAPQHWEAMSDLVKRYARQQFDARTVAQAYRRLYAQLVGSGRAKVP